MTIEIERRVKRHTGNGVATVFTYDFWIPSEDFLKVYRYDTLTEENTLLSAANYSVTGIDNEEGGTVTYETGDGPLSAQQYITIVREMPYAQETNIENQGGFFPDVIERQLDMIVMQIQQLAETISRVPIILEGGSFESPFGDKSALAQKMLGFDEDGEPEALSYADLVNATSLFNAMLTIDCSANPDYPAATKGDVYKVTAAGHIGGDPSPSLENGQAVAENDLILCVTTGAAGTHASAGSRWTITHIRELFDDYVNLGFRAVNEILTDPDDDAIGGQGNVALYGARWIFDLSTDEVDDIDDETLRWHSTLGVKRTSAGLDYSATTSVNKSDSAAIFQSTRGATTNEYLDDLEKGQQIGIRVDVFAPRAADSGISVGQIRKAYVENSPLSPLAGAVSGHELELIFVNDESPSELLLSVGARVGSAPPHDNTNVDWEKSGLAYHAKLTADSDDYKMHAGFLMEDNAAGGNTGVKHILVAHHLTSNPPYFSISGKGDADGGGCVKVANGVDGAPGYTFINGPTSGVYRSSSGGTDVVHIAASGEDCFTGVGGTLKPVSYTVAEANALANMVAGSVIHVTNDVGGGTLAFRRGSNWLRVRDDATITT